jgi:segregation and condensation protein B
MSLSRESKLEAILFFRSEPTSLARLSELLGISSEEVSQAVTNLKESLSERGIILMEDSEGIALGTHPEASSLIEQITKEELSRDLGRAGLETLAVIVYKGSASKREIDHIRGVNSGFILRNLLVRGLVNREERKGERGFVYTPTLDLLAHMGISEGKELPEFDTLKHELDTFLSHSTTEE